MSKRINYQLLISLIFTTLVAIIAIFILIIFIMNWFNQSNEYPAIEGYDIEILILNFFLISILVIAYRGTSPKYNNVNYFSDITFLIYTNIKYFKVFYLNLV